MSVKSGRRVSVSYAGSPIQDVSAGSLAAVTAFLNGMRAEVHIEARTRSDNGILLAWKHELNAMVAANTAAAD